MLKKYIISIFIGAVLFINCCSNIDTNQYLSSNSSVSNYSTPVNSSSIISSLSSSFSSHSSSSTSSSSSSIFQFTITANAGVNGSISPNGSVSVNQGSNQGFIITPNTGYQVSNVTIDGISMGVVTSYTFTNVQINHSINAIFKIIQYTITVSAGAGGSISPSGIVTVNYGTNQSFTITPNNGYQVSNVTVDGISLGTVTSYTFTNVQTNRSISATFIVGDYISANIGTLKPIPSGTFQRDSSASDISSVSAFYMSRYDITRAQYSNVIGSDPSQISCSTGTSDPVQEVNWYMALVFCNKLSMLEGLTPVYTISGSTDPTTWGAIPTSENDATWDAVTANWSANGYRLPTEMEYMWADMGATNDALSGDIVGGVNTGGYAKGYAGSTEAGGAQVNITSYAWLGNNANNTTHPVGILLPNELGLYDMSGNAWHWCWDWYAEYPSGLLTDYRGAASSVFRDSRGGCFAGITSTASVANRADTYPYYQDRGIGLRVVRSSF